MILGQDPIMVRVKRRAELSVPDDIPAPPSLQNILKELADDIGIKESHDLTPWAQQSLAVECQFDRSCWASKRIRCWSNLGTVYGCCD